ncbi:hypothetical protein MKW98_007737, partial [Papaver atlanticum]
VEIYYFGQIKSTGYVCESNYTKPWKESFKLGIGQLIKGLDDGINGMSVTKEDSQFHHPWVTVDLKHGVMCQQMHGLYLRLNLL